MAWAAVSSKAVILLLLVYCLMYSPLFVGRSVFVFVFYALLCVHSSFAILEEEEKASCLAIIVLQMHCY